MSWFGWYIIRSPLLYYQGKREKHMMGWTIQCLPERSLRNFFKNPWQVSVSSTTSPLFWNYAFGDYLWPPYWQIKGLLSLLFIHSTSIYLVTSCTKHCAFGGHESEIEFNVLKPHNIKTISYYSRVMRVWILGLLLLPLDISLSLFLSFSGSRNF